MIETISAIGGAMQGAGSLASALGFGKKGPSMKSIEKQIYATGHANRQELPKNLAAWKQAGLNPLTMLGVGAGQPLQASIGGDSGPSVADRLYDMGQGIQGAANAYIDYNDKKIHRASQELALENQALQNEYIRTQIQQARPVGRPTTALSSPIAGSVIPSGMVGHDDQLSKDVSLTESRSGRYAVVPSEGVKQQIEDMLVPEAQWYMRQILADAPSGYYYHPFTGEYRPLNEDTWSGVYARGWRKAKRAFKRNIQDTKRILKGGK